MTRTPDANILKKLSNDTLSELPTEVARPLYDRAKLTAGIIHIGVGNFHRAHQAWYLHRLMQQNSAHDWAILGAGVRDYDAQMRDTLLAQDCLTTLIELDPSGNQAEVTGAMIDYLPIEAENAAMISAMAKPEIRIVSLTITEGGYYIDPSHGGLDVTHPDIQHDAANPTTPRTAFGAIVAALHIRRQKNAGPFTGLSCDNLQGNGRILRQAVVSLAKQSDPDLATWINLNCSFPNSMVDCIVPATGEDEKALALSLGIPDAAPVTHENFRQWVIEDDFCAGRPDFDAVGAVFTDDVHAYETMKIRLLNGGHQVVANVGELLSLATISDCMKHPLVTKFLEKVQHTEISPYVSPVPDTSASTYIELIHKRFSNTAILDTTRRVAYDGSSRHPGFVLPVLRDALAADGEISGLALVEALWARMCAGTREDGTEIKPNDPSWDALSKAAKTAKSNPKAWIEQRSYYGDLAQNEHFSTVFCNWLNLIWREGSEAALKHYIRS